MVKCQKKVDGEPCKKAAFYGTVFQTPLYCKDHKRAKDISVKKKCVECDNAVAGKDETCSRCAEVYGSIEEFKNMKIKELNDAIASENAPDVSEFGATADRPATPGAKLKKPRKTKPKSSKKVSVEPEEKS